MTGPASPNFRSYTTDSWDQAQAGARCTLFEWSFPVATDLYFNLADTLRLAEHAVAAPEHSPSIGEQLDEQPCPGGLAWVADWGTYLMSTGVPGLRVDPDDPNSANVAVYAEGWGPDSNRAALARTDVGGDDFVEHLHLSTTDGPGQVPLIDQLREGAQRGARYLVLRIDGGTVGLRLSRTDTPNPPAAAARPSGRDPRDQGPDGGPTRQHTAEAQVILEPEHVNAITAGLTVNADEDSDVSTAPEFQLIFEQAPTDRPKWVDLLLIDQPVWRSWDLQQRLAERVSVEELLDLLSGTVDAWMPLLQHPEPDATLIGCSLVYADRTPTSTDATVTRMVIARDIDGRTYHSARPANTSGAVIEVDHGDSPALTGRAAATAQALHHLLGNRIVGVFRLPSTGYVVLHTTQRDGKEPDEYPTFIDSANTMDEHQAIAHVQAEIAELRQHAPSDVVHTLRLVHRTDAGDRDIWAGEPVRGSGPPRG
ncbi:hypothetical protein DMB66_39205 [Actinoplanes sp. ATCC 53533]|nr:hypothetical protein DMB66_39205 [Actinoplanes sp. ATCC 53533]